MELFFLNEIHEAVEFFNLRIMLWCGAWRLEFYFCVQTCCQSFFMLPMTAGRPCLSRATSSWPPLITLQVRSSLPGTSTSTPPRHRPRLLSRTSPTRRRSPPCATSAHPQCPFPPLRATSSLTPRMLSPLALLQEYCHLQLHGLPSSTMLYPDLVPSTAPHFRPVLSLLTQLSPTKLRCTTTSPSPHQPLAKKMT
jgi:hypothetical protein